MALPEWVQTSRYSTITITVRRGDGAAYTFPSGATVTGVLFDRHAQTARALTGTFTPTTGAATCTYAPSAADVADDGEYTVQLTITVGSVPDVSFEETWRIHPKRSVA